MVNSSTGFMIIIPPPGDPTMPIAGPFILSESLKNAGIKTYVFDTSLEFYSNALKPSIQKECFLLLKEPAITLQEVMDECRTQQNLTKDKIGQIAAAAYFLNKIQSAIKFNSDEICFNFSFGDQHFLKEAVEVCRFTIPLFRHQNFWNKINGKVGACIDTVGFSVSYAAQLPFALCIAEVLKRIRPDLNIILGGSCFSSCQIPLNDLLNIFSFVDHIVVGPGEKVVKEILLGKITDSISYGHAGDVSYFPDLKNIKWNNYCVESKMRVIPFSFRVPCYYGKCAFCSGDIDGNVRNFDKTFFIETVIKLKKLCKEHAVTHVYFGDAALPAPILWRVAKEINGAFKWCINARVDRFYTPAYLSFLYNNGCRMLRIGLESASQSVLTAMEKGCDVSYYSKFLQDVTASGINAHIYLMYGYPGETESNRRQTIEFLKSHARFIYSYSVSIFHAIPGTKVYKQLLQSYHLTEEFSGDINQLYYSEKSYRDVLRYDKLTRQALSCAHTNRYCFGGRVFMEHPEVGFDSDPIIQNN